MDPEFPNDSAIGHERPPAPAHAPNDAPQHAWRGDIPRIVGCIVLLALVLVSSSLYVRHIDPISVGQFGLPRLIRYVFLSVGFAALGFLSFYRLRPLAHRATGAGAIILAAGFIGLVELGIQTGSAAAFLLGTLFFALGYVWMTFLVVLCLIQLRNLKSATVAVVGGIIARQLALPLYAQSVDAAVGIVATGVVCVVAILGLTAMAEPSLHELARTEALDGLALTNPFSTLWPPKRLFPCAFLISLAYSMGNSLGVPGMSARRFVVVGCLLVLLWVLLVQREGQEDRLFSLVVVFTMTGLLVAPLMLGRDTFVAHTLLFLGSSCFDILLWLVLYGLGVRNLAAMPPVLGMLFGLNALGSLCGGALGTVGVESPDIGLWQAQAVILGVAAVFFAFMWLCFRDFSFTQAIRGIETSEELRVEDAATLSEEPVALSGKAADIAEKGTSAASSSASSQAKTSRYELVCAHIAKRAGLTPRETEIFELLAHGRNAQYLMDNLHITRNTAKAHISHVYTKLGVHSQQELLSLVERERDA